MFDHESYRRLTQNNNRSTCYSLKLDLQIYEYESISN